MATESPLFQSSMELFGHSISHFNSGAELDRKLLILHLANAVELLLKDLVLDTGESIYQNPKETINIHKCIEILKNKGVTLPYLNKIELLIDERNALQHRFGSPNELTMIFYMDIALAFFGEVLKDRYGQNFNEVLGQFADSKELMAFRMRQPSDESELANLKKLAKVHPLGALLSAMTYLEKKVFEFLKKVGLEREATIRPYWTSVSHRYLSRFGVVVPESLGNKLDEIRRTRNLAAHGRQDPTKDDVITAINTIDEFDKLLGNVNIKNIKATVKKRLEEEEEERAIRRNQQISEKDE
jgi:hypothetical protein